MTEFIAAATVLIEPQRLAEAVDEGASVTLTGDSYRHLFRARRLRVGDRLRVVDGVGVARVGQVVAVERDQARVDVGSQLPDLEPARRLTLIVAAPRAERASWLVEKSTELGVTRIAWLTSERSGRAPTSGHLERHRRVARAAVEQCGRARVPSITGPHSWRELPSLLGGLDRWWVLDPTAEPLPLPVPAAAADGVALIVGPEGGWSSEERDEFAGLGGESWGLGARVLRIETAAIAGTALLLAPA